MGNINYNSFEEKNKINDILNIIYDYMHEKNKTEESNLYKKILIEKISQLNNKNKNQIQDYIYQHSKEVNSRDDKLQLLELYATINNSKNNIEQKNNIDFDVIGGTINGKYKIYSSEIENLGNNEYLIKIIAKKRQNKFINYIRKANIQILYNDKNGIIRYNNGYGKIKIATIDHKYETKFNINQYDTGIYDNINGTIYKKGIPVPIKINYKGQNITLILKF